MTDNVSIEDSASGVDIPVATDDVGGVAYQIIKLDVGGDGVSVPVEGALPISYVTVASSTDVSLASSASSAQLLAANADRRGLLLTNTDATDCYLYYGTTATSTKFTVRIPSDGYWEMPYPIYTGRIDVIWAADGGGSLIGSEL